MGQRGKAAVGVGRVQRQDMHAAYGIPQVLVQHLVKIAQNIAHTIGVTDQLDGITQ
jgi:hypothetical protein